MTLISLINSEREYQSLMWTWMISMALQSGIALALFYYRSVDNIYQLLPNFLFQFKIFGGFILETGAPNAASGFQDFHETSLFSNMAAAMAFGMLLIQKKYSLKFYTLILLFFLFLFITMRTESRAGIGSMMVMLTMLALLLPKLKALRIRFTALFILCTLLIYGSTHIFLYTMTEDTIIPRMVFIIKEIIGGGKIIDTAHKKKKQGRIYIYSSSFQTFFINNPWRGLGVGNLKYLAQLPHAHSFYFSLILDFGLIGCVFLALLAKTVFQQFYLVVQLPDSKSKTLAMAASAGLAGAAVHCLADFEYNYTSVWLILGFVMSSYHLALSAGNRSRRIDRYKTV
jgi:O-antigen ligase